MARAGYRMTPSAQAQLQRILRETTRKWGIDQARKYNNAFLQGLRRLAENYQSFRSPHHEGLAEGTAFLLHLVEHHYVAFQEHEENTIIVAGIFHESMDIPARLRELEALTEHEVSTLRRMIERESEQKPRHKTE